MTKVWSPKNKNKPTNTNTKKKSPQKKKQKTKNKTEKEERDSQSTLTCDDPRPAFPSEADNVGSLTIDYTGPETPRPKTQSMWNEEKRAIERKRRRKGRKERGSREETAF